MLDARWRRLMFLAGNLRALATFARTELSGTIQRVRLFVRAIGLVTIKPAGPAKGNVLVSYKLDPFIIPQNGASHDYTCYFHANAWRTREIVRIFVALGYKVDVVSDANRWFVPREQYSVVVGTRMSMERLAKLVGRDCLKIMHLDTADTLALATGELQRLRALQQRRGAILPTNRFEPPNPAIGYADWATLTGNDVTRRTYITTIPIHTTPVAPRVLYPWPEEKNFAVCRRSFLWFGNEGLVHKGLDLVLEAFASMPDMRLYVCGPISKEKEFEAEFYKELYELPNIRTIGWVDVEGSEFKQVLNDCGAIVFPSCSEGQSGSVITCMHAGLIPIITRESGVDIDGFGEYLTDCSISGICAAVLRYAAMPAHELKAESRRTWEFARSRYTREAFSRKYRELISGFLANSSRESAGQSSASHSIPARHRACAE
jgi:glycosyltransferase involved in cell wall biosynthesis